MHNVKRTIHFMTVYLPNGRSESIRVHNVKNGIHVMHNVNKTIHVMTVYLPNSRSESIRDRNVKTEFMLCIT